MMCVRAFQNDLNIVIEPALIGALGIMVRVHCYTLKQSSYSQNVRTRGAEGQNILLSTHGECKVHLWRGVTQTCRTWYCALYRRNTGHH